MDFSQFKIVRLSAELFPITAFEQEKYDEFGISPVAVEVPEPELVSTVADADAVMLVSQYLRSDVIRSMQKCRVICRLGAGTDRVDIGAATEQGIVVANVPDFCYEEQADHAFAMLLALARKLNEMRNRTLDGRFHDGRQESRPLRRLPGQTLGLVGFGGSAKAMARRAAGFGLNVLATRRNPGREDPEIDTLGITLVGLGELLRESDFVSLHLPLTDQTRHLIDAVALAKMKAGSLLINTARGAIVDEEALADSLETGHLAGAGLDTFSIIDVHDPAPQPPSHRLFRLENVLFSPHVAAFSQDSSRQVGYGSVENLVAVLSGHWPPHDRTVNPDVVPRFALME